MIYLERNIGEKREDNGFNSKNLSKQFVDFKLDNISFELPRGSVMGLIGPNGSGKTTTIKLILNMLKKSGENRNFRI